MGKSGGPGNAVLTIRRYATYLAAIWTAACLILTAFNALTSAREDNLSALISFGLLWGIGLTGIVVSVWKLVQHIQEREPAVTRYQSVVEDQSVGREVTERRQAETDLREQRDRAQQYLDIAGVMFIAINTDQTVGMINRKGCDILGWPEDEIVGKNWFDHFIPERDRQRIREVFDSLIAGETNLVEYYENTILTRSGEERIVAWHNSLLRDQTGAITGTVSSGEDITERKQAERERERLLVAEREQRLLAETLTEIALVLTSQISQTAALDALLDQAHRLVPYAAANIMLLEGEMMVVAGWRGYDVLGGEDLIANLVQPLPTFQVDADANHLGKPVIISDTRTDPRWKPIDEIAWIRSNITLPIRLGNRGLGLLHLDSDVPGQFTTRDAERLAPLAGIAAIALENARLYADLEAHVMERTAELSAAKTQTDTILQNVADAIVFTDIDNNILFVNPAWERLNGYTFAEVAGKNPRILKSGETPEAQFEDMWQTILAGNVWRGVLKNRRKDGTIYDNELTIAPVKNQAGSIEFFVGIQRDVTESRELEAMKARFIANAAHDLNNPIASLSLRLHLMKNAPERLGYHIEVMEGQIQHLTALVDDLLTLSRLDSGTVLPELVPTDLNAIVGLIVESQQPLTEHGGVTLRFKPDENVAPVLADSRQLERVVINLLTNALNYSPEKSEVTVSVEEAGEGVLLVVSDSGIGIAPEELGHIFERFYRSEEARKTAKGTGLGLAIVEEIVNRHHGKIEVESAVGEGSTIRVYLPYLPPD